MDWDGERRAREIERRLVRLRWVKDEEEKEFTGMRGVVNWMAGRNRMSGKELYQRMLRESEDMLMVLAEDTGGAEGLSEVMRHTGRTSWRGKDRSGLCNVRWPLGGEPGGLFCCVGRWVAGPGGGKVGYGLLWRPAALGRRGRLRGSRGDGWCLRTPKGLKTALRRFWSELTDFGLERELGGMSGWYQGLSRCCQGLGPTGPPECLFWAVVGWVGERSMRGR